MDNYYIEIKTNIADLEGIHIVLNGKSYQLTPIASHDLIKDSQDIPSLAVFTQQLITDLREKGRMRTSETYRCALNRFLEYIHDDITFDRIDSTLIKNYEQFLKEKGLTSNSSSFYMRVLRTIYNKAVAHDYTCNHKPFTQVYTGIAKTVKRALPIESIKKIRLLTGLNAFESLARDLFLFSFYTRGMSFIDIAYLKPQDINNGILTYKRHKTGQKLVMKWESQMQDIVDRHPSPNKDYLLPIIKRSNGHERCQYREAQSIVNNQLKEIARKAGIETKLTMYVARHSWASIAKSMNTPINIISEGMGHNSEQTTQIYLKSLNNKTLNTVNANIINAVISNS